MSGFVCHDCRCAVDFDLRGNHEPGCVHEHLRPLTAPLATEAHARTTDPWTSHAAARTVTGQLRATQEAVLACFKLYGPLHHELLIENYDEAHRRNGWPRQSVSGLRTRTKELVDAGLIEDSGRVVVLPSGRRSIVWKEVTRT